MKGLIMPLSEKILENMRCRTAAEALVELGLDVCRSEKLDPRAFWVVVATKAMDMAGVTKEYHERHGLGKTRKFSPMDDTESRYFGKKTIEFGIHLGKRYDEVPLLYLEWLAQRHQEGMEVVRYIESRRVQAETMDSN